MVFDRGAYLIALRCFVFGASHSVAGVNRASDRGPDARDAAWGTAM